MLKNMEFKRFIQDNEGSTSVESVYSPSELLQKTIVRNEITNVFTVFDNKKEFEKWYNKQAIKTYHEVIMGNKIQRLKFDIDINVIDIDIESIIQSIITCIIEVIASIANTVISYKDFIVTDSSGKTDTGYKHSYHIILYTHAVRSNKEAAYITQRVIEKVPQYKTYIDINVNKSLQNFRLLSSCKQNSSRVKVLTSKFGTSTDVSLFDTMIVPFDGIKLLPMVELEEKLISSDTLDDDLAQKILSCVKKLNITDGHKIREYKGNSIYFDRIRPTHCQICDEIHHKDNSLVIQYSTSTHGIYEYCRQGIKNRYLCNLHGKEYKKVDITKIVTKDTDQFSQLPMSCKHSYSANVMKEYELVDTLVVHAQMKLGKTKQLHKFIQDNFSNTSDVIRFITFRQTFSHHIYGIFNDFELYSNIKTPFIDTEKYKRIIIQVESLYRLQLADPIDLLVLDEVESILQQLGSGLHKNFNSSFAMFLWLLKSAKHVICMDANISDRTYNILKKFRNKEIFYHHNTWKTSTNENYYITYDKNIWLGHLFSKLNDNKKVVIPTNSIKEAKTCEYLIKQEFPNLNVKVYSSEIKYSEKQEHFNNVHKYWTELEVLIYTPTCSAGISYELEHFDVLFGLFYNTSCNVETCRQMMGRVREIIDKEYYLLLQEIEMPKLPETAHDLQQYLYNKRMNIANYVNDANLSWNYEFDGSVKFYETDYYYIWLENMSINNMSKNDFILRFCTQIRHTGAKLHNLSEAEDSQFVDHTNAKQMIGDKQNTDIAESAELVVEQVEEILSRIDKQQDIEPEERYAYEKYKLRKIYKYEGEITQSFVKYYKMENVQKVYRNLCDITQCTTIQESIEAIIKKEQDRYNVVINNMSAYRNKLEYYDLHNDLIVYSGISHVITCKIISLIGTNTISVAAYDTLINEQIGPFLTKHSQHLAIELKIDMEKDKKKIVNSLLKTMYGLRMYKQGNELRLKRVDGIANLFKITEHPIPSCVNIITSNKLFLSIK